MRASRGTWILAWLLCLACVACGAVVPSLPGQGGPAWLELKSENFTLWTNSSPSAARDLLRKLEDQRKVILRAMNHKGHRERVLVVALRSERELRAFVPSQFTAVAWPQDNPLLAPGIALAMDTEDSTVVTHELAHAISHSIVQAQPPWLAEGIASYFEMAVPDPDTHEVQVGVPNRGLLELLKKGAPLRVQELFDCRDVACRTAEFYATSWALFTYLLNEHFEALSRYFLLLNTLPAIERDQAWPRAFPSLTAEALDRELSGWIYAGAFRLPRFRVPVQQVASTERTLTDADVLSARGLMYWNAGQMDASVKDARAAVDVAPIPLEAALLATAHELPLTLETVQAVVAANEQDWRAWWILIPLLPDDDGLGPRTQAICTLVKLRPSSPMVRAALKDASARCLPAAQP